MASFFFRTDSICTLGICLAYIFDQQAQAYIRSKFLAAYNEGSYKEIRNILKLHRLEGFNENAN